ncbi:MAG: hypothetical protein RL641_571 [Candidatus Parcubacteria bacterium]|jgi:hypothetical protein
MHKKDLKHPTVVMADNAFDFCKKMIDKFSNNNLPKFVKEELHRLEKGEAATPTKELIIAALKEGMTPNCMAKLLVSQKLKLPKIGSNNDQIQEELRHWERFFTSAFYAVEHKGEKILKISGEEIESVK